MLLTKQTMAALWTHTQDTIKMNTARITVTIRIKIYFLMKEKGIMEMEEQQHQSVVTAV